jgi:hypothetical protein
MPLKIFVRKKKFINESEQEEVKKDLDKKKVDNLDKMVELLSTLNTNITNIQTIQSTTKPRTKTKRKTKTKEFIPSIDTKHVSDKVTSVKKSTKKRKLSSTVNKLKDVDK